MFALYHLTVSFIDCGEDVMRTKSILVSMIISGVASSANTLGDKVVFRDFVCSGDGAVSANCFADTSSVQNVVWVVSQVVSVQQHIAARS